MGSYEEVAYTVIHSIAAGLATLDSRSLILILWMYWAIVLVGPDNRPDLEKEPRIQMKTIMILIP